MIEVGIISFSKYKQRVIAVAKGYSVPYPEIKHYAVNIKHAKLKFGINIKPIYLDKLPTYLEL